MLCTRNIQIVSTPCALPEAIERHVLLFAMQVNEAAEIIYDLVDPNANLIFGAVVDQALGQEVSQTRLLLVFIKAYLFTVFLASVIAFVYCLSAFYHSLCYL